MYGTFLATLTCLYLKGPHRHPTFGEKYAKVHDWSLWKSWMKFFAFEIVADNYDKVKHLLGNPTHDRRDSGGGIGTVGSNGVDSRLQQAILGMSVHIWRWLFTLITFSRQMPCVSSYSSQQLLSFLFSPTSDHHMVSFHSGWHLQH